MGIFEHAAVLWAHVILEIDFLDVSLVSPYRHHPMMRIRVISDMQRIQPVQKQKGCSLKIAEALDGFGWDGLFLMTSSTSDGTRSSSHCSPFAVALLRMRQGGPRRRNEV